MKKIAVFGCSFSAGCGDDGSRWHNWPAELSLLTNDEYEIINCAKGGSSLNYAATMLNEYLNTYDKPDLIIFQLTALQRLTWIKSDPNTTQATLSMSEDTHKLFKFEDYYDAHINLPNRSLIDPMRYSNLKNFYLLKCKHDYDTYRNFLTIGGSQPQASNYKTELKPLYENYFSVVGDDLISLTELSRIIGYVKFLCERLNIPHLIVSHDRDFFYYVDKLNKNKDTSFYNLIDLDFRESLGDIRFKNSMIDEGYHLNTDALHQIAWNLLELIKERRLI